ncbi:MAG: hypothetical protein ACJ8D6_08935 [Sphingomicrobium sp.]
MTIVAIIIAVVLALLAFRFVKGVMKIGCLALILIILVAGMYFLSNFQVHG